MYGRLAVDVAEVDAAGLKRVDVRFEAYCDDIAAPLRGAFRWVRTTPLQISRVFRNVGPPPIVPNRYTWSAAGTRGTALVTRPRVAYYPPRRR
jgi:hypothetical protein